MAEIFEIPTEPATPQKFSISLSGLTRQLTLTWCQPAGCWILDIADASAVPILSGIPLITGADLLAQFGYLGLGGAMLVQTDHNADAVPTFDNLGDTGHLFFMPTGAAQ
jgi:hypothetical protein